MIKGKFLFTTTIKDYQINKINVEFSVYGLFDTQSVHWSYYVISHIPFGNDVKLTSDICQYEQKATHDNVKNYGKCFKTKEEGIEYIQNFKDKWETTSNDTKKEKREQKINDVLGYK
jgi:hypothetical protein